MVVLKRVYSKEYEPTTKEKERSNRREKECIGRYAASLVTKGETIYMDAGDDNASDDSAF